MSFYVSLDEMPPHPAVVQLSDLVSSKRALVTLPTSATVREAFQLLHAEQILSIPIVSAPNAFVGAGGSELVIGDEQFVGIISTLDLVAHVFRHFLSKPEEADAREALLTPVWRVLGSTNESLSLWTEEADTGLAAALAPFALGVHRAIITPVRAEHPGGVPKLLTQTDVLKYLLDARHTSATLARVLECSLRQLGIKPLGPARGRPVWACIADTPLVDAVGTMVQRNVQALAVLDGKTGLLLSTFSVSDLRHLTPDSLPQLAHVSVGEFLKTQNAAYEVSREDPLLGAKEPEGGAHLPPPLTCRLDAPLSLVIFVMLRRHVHRLWLVGNANDDAGSLRGHGLAIGVVSYTDVIRIVYDAIYQPHPAREV